MTAAEVATVGRALGHPLRVRIVEELDARRMAVLAEADGRIADLTAADFAISPKALAAAVGKPIPNLSYHVTILHKLGAVALTGQEPRRGAVEHFYALTPFGRTVADMAARLAR